MKSIFKFQITQSIEVLLYKIEQADGKRWKLRDVKKGEYYLLEEVDNPESMTAILIDKGVMTIAFANTDYNYLITNLSKDGAEVMFFGPVNALLSQALMPRLHYVEKTLLGKSEEMEDFVPIAEFMEDRAKHNASREPNPQDRHGYRVNSRFYNELVPYLPSSHSVRKMRRK